MSAVPVQSVLWMGMDILQVVGERVPLLGPQLATGVGGLHCPRKVVGYGLDPLAEFSKCRELCYFRQFLFETYNAPSHCRYQMQNGLMYPPIKDCTPMIII